MCSRDLQGLHLLNVEYISKWCFSTIRGENQTRSEYMFLYKSRFLQLILCVIYPFLYLGAYALTDHYRIGYLTVIIFVGLWVVYSLVLKTVYHALICNGLALVVTLPLVYHLLVVHDTTSNYDFFPVVDIVVIIGAFLFQIAIIVVRNAIMFKNRGDFGSKQIGE